MLLSNWIRQTKKEIVYGNEVNYGFNDSRIWIWTMGCG